MNKLAEVAKQAVKAGRIGGIVFPTEKGLCQKFIRLCLESAYGSGISEKFRADSAKDSAMIWLQSGHGFRTGAVPGGLQEGDLLYKTVGSGGFGHVAIYVGNGMVAENSSTAIGRVRGALGFRSLTQFGAYQVVGRWPDASEVPVHVAAPVAVAIKAPPQIFLNDVALPDATATDGHLHAPVRAVLAALGFEITKLGDHRADTNRFYIYAKKSATKPVK